MSRSAGPPRARAQDANDYSDDGNCSKRAGQEEGRCTPGWFGICHGWAPYAISESAALKPVVRKAPDGTEIIFFPGDIEGLMSMLYTNRATRFLSSRCNKDESKITYDASGRVLEGECRDMNAGSFHILATNMMGLRNKGFVIDQTWDDEVWNQPAYGFQVKNAEYKYNTLAVRFFEVVLDFSFVEESRPEKVNHVYSDFLTTRTYSYVLEADQDGRILGGEWTGESRKIHPDFAWWPVEGSSPAPETAGILYSDVKALNDEASQR